MDQAHLDLRRRLVVALKHRYGDGGSGCRVPVTPLPTDGAHSPFPINYGRPISEFDKPPMAAPFRDYFRFP